MERYKINSTCVEKGTMDCHIEYFSFLLHEQDFWIPNSIPTNDKNTPEIAKNVSFCIQSGRFVFYMDVVCDVPYKYEVCEL